MMMGQIVLPGDKISDKPLHMDSIYVKDGKSYAAVIGMLDEEGRYTPLEGRYSPKMDDTVVGVVNDSASWGYSVDLNIPQRGSISSKETRTRYHVGDIVFAKVKGMGNMGDVLLTYVKLLSRGKIFKVPASKVPRIIGRKSSMLDMIREKTNTHIIVGNNGYVWASEQGNVPLVAKVLNEIVENAHKKGLTDKIGEFIESNK